MINNKTSWFVFVSAITLLSGCLTKGAIENVLSSQLPYGLSAAGVNSSYPQRDFSSAQRAYSSKSTSTSSEPKRAFTSKNSSLGCLQNIDQTEMERRAQKATAFSEEIKALCSAGKRDKATKRAMEFGKEMAGNSGMTKEMKECLAKQSLPYTPPMPQPYEKGKTQHVCDSF